MSLSVTKNIVAVCLFVLMAHPFVSSQELKPSKPQELSALQKQARDYREQGYKEQTLGNLENAFSLFQKAVQIDPSYAVAYNDLGVISEIYGRPDAAEQDYLQAIKVGPDFLSAYSNLALLYENKRDLEKAFFYWKRRAELGSPDDPWTQKANKRIKDLMQVIPGLKQAYIEGEMFDLINEAVQKKKIMGLERQEEAKRHLEKARALFNEGRYSLAIDEINLSLALNPENIEAEELFERARMRLQEQQRIETTKRLHEYFEKGKRVYQ